MKKNKGPNINTHLEEEEEFCVVRVLNHADSGSRAHEDDQPEDQQHYAGRYAKACSWDSRLPVCAVGPGKLASPCNPTSRRIEQKDLEVMCVICDIWYLGCEAIWSILTVFSNYMRSSITHIRTQMIQAQGEDNTALLQRIRIKNTASVLPLFHQFLTTNADREFQLHTGLLQTV